jgi:hypothetical protein
MENSKSEKSNTNYKGIHFRKDIGKFRAHLRIYRPSDQGTINVEIGSFDTLKEAIEAREKFIKSLF